MNKILPFLQSIATKIFAAIVALFFFNSSSCFATVRYAKIGGAGTAPYTSWATASNDLQAVINQCVAGDEIWVATGTYKPNRRADALTVITTTDRNDAFVLKNAVKIYGGFTGVETLLSQRNSTTNIVTLSGDIGTAGVTTDNCYHVVINANTASTTTLLDGVSISSGNANATVGVASVTVNTFAINPRYGGGMYKVSSNADITDCRFRRNDASVSGAGIYETISSSASVYTNCTITQNVSANDGGGVYILTSSCIYQTCSFTSNDATGEGAGMYVSGSASPAFTDCTISSNDATGSGGGVYLAGTGSPSFDDCTIITNTSGSNGGGIYNAASAPHITSCDIEQNEAVNNGGGIYNTSSSPVLSGNSIIDNEAGNHGGGIFNTASSITVSNGNITGNIAGNNGGAVYNDASSDGTFTSLKILTNSAANGGAVYNNNSSPSFSGCAFHYNTASASGGAVYNSNSDAVEFDICAFKFNTAVANGGAICFSASAALKVKHCTLQGNSATSNGGAMFLIGSAAAVINCLVTGNLAGNGGAVYNTSSSPVFTNCTVAANKSTSAGGGFYNLGGASLTIRNGIVWGNITVGSGNNLFSATALTITYSDIEGGYAGAGNINSNPFFTAPLPAASAPVLDGNYRAQKCSPVINAGNNSLIPSGITEDIVGDDRINYAIVDMGAYEKTLAVKAPSGIIYVDHAKNGDGSQWGKAIPSLADALLTAKYNTSITEIWVAKGTYYPGYNATNLASLVCNSANRYNSFVLVNNVKVYGGFENGAASLAERDPQNNVTILSGDIDGDNTSAGNTYHVVISADAVGTAALDGFTITGGNADYSGNTVTVNGITVTSFYGGGMGISRSAPAINNCILEANHGDHGGAISVLSGSPVFNRCIIRNNTAKFFGGALDHYVIGPPSFAVFNNCLITGNRSEQYGGAFVNTYPSVISLNNSTVAGNFALVQGGGLWSNGAASEIFKNSIVWGNKVGTTANNIYTVSGTVNATYCDIEGGYAGAGNISSNPLFINPQLASAAPTAAGDYRLQKCSPAINVGSNALIPVSITKDLDSSSRISLLIVDMGAYEKHLSKPDANGIVYVDSSNTVATGDGSTWAKAVTELADALKEARTNTGIKEIWVAKGTYKPIYNAADIYLNSICNSTNRDAAFVLAPDVKIYGGFAGGETDTSGRNFVINHTTLSGDIGITNDITDNCYHVVVSNNIIMDNAVLDGFAITKGNANGGVNEKLVINNLEVYKKFGGGMSNSYTTLLFVNNCSFYENKAEGGGGMVNTAAPISVTNSLFFENIAELGAGIINNTSDVSILNCSFSGNTATVLGGGGIWNVTGFPVIKNCSFSGNTAAIEGGAIHNIACTPAIINCTVSGNKSSTFGGGISNDADAFPLIKNCILWGNTASTGNSIYPVTGLTGVADCIVEGGYASGTNIANVNPLFISPQLASTAPTTLGNYRLQACSPAINIGNNSVIIAPADLDGNTRIAYTDVDLGAYEVQTIDLSNSTWKGINTNWNDKINWCGGYIPIATTNVIIPSSLTNYPVTALTNEVKNISLGSSTSVDVTSAGSLTINGTYSNLGSTITNNGDWVMAGNATAQTFPGANGTVAAMKNLELKNTAGISLDKSFSITGTLTPTAGIINTNNATITLVSNATGTARVAEVKAAASFTYTGTGQFAVERYHPARRAWRLMTSPLYGTGTIFDTWQNGGVYTVGKGLLVTGNPATGAAGNGLDISAQMNFSLKTGMPITAIGNTKVALSNNTGLGADNKGYFIFVRGDRNPLNTIIPNMNATTLSSSGKLQYGAQNFTATGTAGAYTLIGNPYASPVNFALLNKTNLANRFYTWDPKLNVVGGWVVVEKLSTAVPYVTDVASPGGQDSIIQSSQAVYVQTLTTAAASLGFVETNKSATQNFGMFRPANPLQHIAYIKSALYIRNADSNILADGNLVLFNDDFNDGVDAGDALKFININETFSLLRNGQGLAIERKKLNPLTDTVFLKLTKTTPLHYQFDFELNQLPVNGQAPFLEDAFLQNATPLFIDGNTKIDFSISSDAASFNAERFRIVFKPSAIFTNVSAMMVDDNIEVKWTNSSEFDIEKYEVEVSTDGINFIPLGINNSVANHQQSAAYNLMHLSPAAGIYYYRIKSTSKHGTIAYSNIVNAKMIHSKPGIIVYPNPVTNNEIRLKMNDLPVGKYQYHLYNALGQLITSGSIHHAQRFASHSIEPRNTLVSGMYKLEMMDENKKVKTVKVLVQ